MMVRKEGDSDPIQVEGTGMDGVYKGKEDTAKYLDVATFSGVIGLPLTEDEMERAKKEGLLPDICLKRDGSGRILVRADFFESDIPRISAYIRGRLRKGSRGGSAGSDTECTYLNLSGLNRVLGVELGEEQLVSLAEECGLSVYRSLRGSDIIVRYDFEDRKGAIAEKARKMAGKGSQGGAEGAR